MEEQGSGVFWSAKRNEGCVSRNACRGVCREQRFRAAVERRAGQVAPVFLPRAGQVAPVFLPRAGQVAPAFLLRAGQVAPAFLPRAGQVAPAFLPRA